jgi:hypothetical protein
MSSSEENFDIDNVSGSESDDYFSPAAKKVSSNAPFLTWACLTLVVQGSFKVGCEDGTESIKGDLFHETQSFNEK